MQLLLIEFTLGKPRELVPMSKNTLKFNDHTVLGNKNGRLHPIMVRWLQPGRIRTITVSMQYTRTFYWSQNSDYYKIMFAIYTQYIIICVNVVFEKILRCFSVL